MWNQTKQMKVQALTKLIPILCGFLLTTILFCPPIQFSDRLPAIELVDIFLPVLALILLFKWKDLEFKKLILLLVIFATFILISIIVNHRLNQLSDYFEIYKLVKFSILIYIFSFINPDQFENTWIKPLFIGLVVFNILHYFNLFQFNLFLEQVYFGHNNYTEFGLNSAGLPNSKRMMGLTANPNNNAIIFSIFAIFFLPKKPILNWNLTYFAIAVIMIFLCQSRTAMLAFPFILTLYIFLTFRNYKLIVVVILISITSALIANLISLKSIGVGTPINMEMVRKFEEKHPNLTWDDSKKEFLRDGQSGTGNIDYTYLESVVHGEFIEGSSMKGRYEIWIHLWQMIKQKPLFGHAPSKEYFYDNKIYGENEFILMTWRYGFIGLTIYMSVIIYLIVIAWTNRTLKSAQNLLMVIILFGIVSLTNVPFAAITLNMLFAIVIGIFFADLRLEKQKNKLVQ
jgi:O-antigen ligase